MASSPPSKATPWFPVPKVSALRETVISGKAEYVNWLYPIVYTRENKSTTQRNFIDASDNTNSTIIFDVYRYRTSGLFAWR